MRISKAFCLASLIGLGIVSVASADNVTFNAAGSFGDGATLVGSLVINTTTGVVSSNGIDLTVTGGNNSVNLTFNTLTSSANEGETNFDGAGDNLWFIDFGVSGNNQPFLGLVIDLGQATTLTGFAGGVTSGAGSLCDNNNETACTATTQAFFSSSYSANRDPNLVSGELSASGAPEPASFLLFAVPAFLLFRRQRKA